MSDQKKQIKVSEILALLQDGKTRKEIQEEYSLSTSEMKVLFSHPKLKNKKVKKALSFILEDDTEEEVSAAETPNSVSEEVNSIEEDVVAMPEPVKEVEEEIPAIIKPTVW